jgi:hypothetical protein
LLSAVASNARPQTTRLLHQLPGRTCTNIREVWYDLPGVPVTA